MNIEAGRNQRPTDQHFLACPLRLGSIRKLVTQASSNPDVYLDQLLLDFGTFMTCGLRESGWGQAILLRHGADRGERVSGRWSRHCRLQTLC
ncbi:MAG: hypothetical protein ACJ8AI_26780 [Rhodopila sp.]|jgi:hypothetical protein